MTGAADGRHRASFDVLAGEERTFATTWTPSHHAVPKLLEFDARIEAMRNEPPKMADFQLYFSDWRETASRSR